MKFLIVAIPLLFAAPIVEAKCAKQVLTLEEAERGTYSYSSTRREKIQDILDGMRSSTNISETSDKIYCELVDVEITRRGQVGLMDMVVSDVRPRAPWQEQAFGQGLARYAAAMLEAGRNHDADTVTMFTLGSRDSIISYYLDELNRLGIDQFTADSRPELLRARKISDYEEMVAEADAWLEGLLSRDAEYEPFVEDVLAGLEKSEDRMMGFLRRGFFSEHFVNLTEESRARQDLRIVNGEPSNIVTYQAWSYYTEAAAEFEDRKPDVSESFTIECRFPAQTMVDLGQPGEKWQVDFVSYEGRKLVFDCRLD